MILEAVGELDMPTKYMLVFTLAWFWVLVLFAIFSKSKKKIIFAILAFIPLINFGVFYLFNYSSGDQSIGFARYGAHLAAAVIYMVAGLIISKTKRKVLPLIISGILASCLAFWAGFYVLVFGNAYHLGNFSHYGYEKSMAKLIDELEKNYVLRDHKEIDFEYLRQIYIPMAAQAEKDNDETAFGIAVANLCYEFHDGHLSMRITDEELSTAVSEKMAGNDYGFSMIRTDNGKVIAILTDVDSEAFQKGIHNGVEITEWDGIPIGEAISGVRCVQSNYRMCAYPIAQNEEMVKPIFLAGMGGDTISVKFIDDDGVENEITVSSYWSYLERLSNAVYPISGKRCYEFGYAEMLDEHCGYLCIPREEFDDVKDVSASLNDDYPEVRELLISRIEGLKAQGMDRLIIDLRDNDGGLDVVYEEVVSLFTNEEMVAHGAYYDGEEYHISNNWAWTIRPDGRYSDIPVVALVNAGCASSGDMLAYRLSCCPNVTLMGMTTTWGSAQSLGGECLLSGSRIVVRYPLIATMDYDGTLMIDAGKDRISSIVLDEKIPLDEKAVHVLYDMNADYDLAYARHYINTREDQTSDGT